MQAKKTKTNQKQLSKGKNSLDRRKTTVKLAHQSSKESSRKKDNMSATARASRLLTEERKRKIVELLANDGRVKVNDLARRFGVSAVTIRGDLDVLSQNGSLVRSHGGAVQRQEHVVPDYPIEYKEALHHAEKVRIGRAAAQLVQPGQTILLDSGTTTVEMARHLKQLKIKSLTVITHALNVATELADEANITLVMIGGILRQVSRSFVGPQAERMLRDFHVDHCFLAVDGLDVETGASTPDILEAQLNALMLGSAREVTVVADASKIGRRSLSVIGPLSRIHRVVTDVSLGDEMVAVLRERGVEVITV